MNDIQPVNLGLHEKNDVYIGRSDITVIHDHDTISTLQGMISYCAKLTGEDLLLI